MDSFEKFFKSYDPVRDNYLSRLFGLFSEQVVRDWCKFPMASYEDLGRPTLLGPDERRGPTLDFTLRNRVSGLTCVAELKCEIAYRGYSYLRLAGSSQLLRERGPAFNRFLKMATESDAFQVKIGGSACHIDGAILVWGATTPAGRDAVIDAYGFVDVLSVEDMLKDLAVRRPTHWIERIDRLQGWSEELFNFLFDR
jgi:hypothetical protein